MPLQSLLAHRPSKPFYGWAVVFVAALIAFSSGPGQSFVFSVFIDSMIEDTGFSRTHISALYAVGTGISAVMVMVISRLADRYGPRLVVTFAAFALGVTCFGMGFATGAIAFFIAFSALRALGQGSLPINATLVTAQWFSRNRGRAVAVMGLGFTAANAILPPVSRTLIDTIGWREAYMVLGVMVWVLVIPAGLLLLRNTPEEIGLHPDGASHPPVGEPPKHPGGDGPDRRKVFGSPMFWFLALPLATPGFVSTALVFHQTAIFVEQGLSPAMAASIFIPLAGAAVVSSFIAGYVADRLGPKALVVANMAALLVALGLALVLTSPVLAVLYAIVLGAANGMTRVVNGVTWAHYYGRNRLGRIQGSAMTVMISSSALGPLPLAAFQGATGTFAFGIMAMALLPVAAALTILFTRPKRVQAFVGTAV